MATVKRDYYEVLGVARDADQAEIKKTFRRLARDLHPDVSEHPDAQERFREAAEAYEVLSKRETRELYDRFGHDGLTTGGFRPSDFDFTNLSDIFAAFFGEDLFGAGRQSARGADVLVEVEVELGEAAEGVSRALTVPLTVSCRACAGSGASPGTTPQRCARCGGAGRLQAVSSSVFGQFVQTQTCPACRGRGEVVADPCPTCEGQGRVREERALEVEIPPGIHDGQRIRLTGEGHAGASGGRAGDVYVLVRVRAHEHFVRDVNDVVSTVDLTITQAALGATVRVPTLEGETELEFRPGTQAGDTRVLRGKGMPVLQGFGRGDHRLVVNVLVPRNLSADQRKLLEEFELVARPANYEPDEGFFEKIRAAFR